MLMPFFQQILFDPTEYLAGIGPQREQMLQAVNEPAEVLLRGATEAIPTSLALFWCKARQPPLRLLLPPILFGEARLPQEAGASALEHLYGTHRQWQVEGCPAKRPHGLPDARSQSDAQTESAAPGVKILRPFVAMKIRLVSKAPESCRLDRDSR